MSKDLHIVDTHAHLCDRVFDPDRAEVIGRARAAGIEKIIIVAETLEDARRNLVLAEEFPVLKPAAGLYPEYVDLEGLAGMLDFIRQQHQKLYAIGEVGLDFWIAKEDEAKELQREVFKQFIRLAAELDLPLNVHSRSAGRHAVAALLDANAARVQMHAFDGKASAALPAVEAGFFFSMPPSLARSRQKQKLIKQLPLSCLLVESDSPVLGPDPEERNEPVNILTAVRAIAEIKALPYEEVLAIVCENTRKLYPSL
jgi:TatD DNase family protein